MHRGVAGGCAAGGCVELQSGMGTGRGVCAGGKRLWGDASPSLMSGQHNKRSTIETSLST